MKNSKKQSLILFQKEGWILRLIIIIKNKLTDNHNHHYDFQINIDEFVKIIVFVYEY